MIDQHQKEFIKHLKNVATNHDQYTVFRDFCEMAAITFANSVEFNHEKRAKREEQYLQITKKYNSIQIHIFPKMLACVIMSLTENYKDCLGEIYMNLELGNKQTGQFFTPYELSLTSAKMILSDAGELIKEKGYITLNEPACGSGGMVIAAAQTLKEAGVNYQTSMHVTAQDVDAKCVHMAYIQLSLLNIPAYVILGNTLALEERELWVTPAHYTTRLWDHLLNKERQLPKAA